MATVKCGVPGERGLLLGIRGSLETYNLGFLFCSFLSLVFFFGGSIS